MQDHRLEKVLDKLDVMNARLTAIEADLRHHISRSDKLEKLVQQHERYFWMALGAISLAGPLANRLLEVMFK